MRSPRTLSLLAAAVFAAFAGSALAAGEGARPLAQPNGLFFGAYDPHGDFGNDSLSTIEHLFLPWEDVDLTSLAAADSYAAERGRTLLVTIEPWTWSQSKHIAPEDLRAGIMSGQYDGNISAICSVLASFKSPTTIRWAQEMEDTTGRFIWADWDPADYIAAYRRVVETCRAIAPNVAFMWSPKGNDNLGDYYPGDDVVDVVGLSVFGLQANDHFEAGRDRAFSELVRAGYLEAAKFGKPVYVAEVGYSGDAAYVESWASELLSALPQFPLLQGVVYFNDRDVVSWPHDLGIPNWQVTSNIAPDVTSVAQVADKSR